MKRPSRLAALTIVFLLVYYEVYRWVPLGRWNWQFHWPVTNDQFYPDLVIGALLLVFASAFVRGWKPLIWTAVLLLGFWVGVHLFDWWIPYATDSIQNYPRYSFYAQHTQILPVAKNHYPPDGGHAVLDFILYPTWIVSFIAAISASKRNKQGSPRS